MRTSLYDRHLALGGKPVDFAGWELPVQYAGILTEHKAVRERAGVFDVSHMGQLLVTGQNAYAWLQRMVTNDLGRLCKGRAVYSPLCREHGGTVDDLILYPRGADIFICANASNTDKVFAWLCEHVPADVKVNNVSAEYAQIALQGPQANAILETLGAAELAALPFFGCAESALLGKTVFAAATGYTGERGAELYLKQQDAGEIWDALLTAGAEPCGLGARDSLRLEAGLPLYGHELSESISPVMAGLSRFVKPGKGEFMGRAALLAQAENPATPRLRGLTTAGRAIPRAGYEVYADGSPAGTVTSGGPSPTLGGGIAMALLTREGQTHSILIRGKEEPAVLTELPFLKK